MAFHSLLGIPTIGHAVWYVVQSIIIFFVIVIIDRLVAHGVDAKHAIYMSFGAFFIGQLIPLILALIDLSIPSILVTLIIWIILSESLLEGDTKEKLIVGVIAFVAFIALDLSPLNGMVVDLVNTNIGINF